MYSKTTPEATKPPAAVRLQNQGKGKLKEPTGEKGKKNNQIHYREVQQHSQRNSLFYLNYME